MSHQPLISIVVPCYNYARYLGECVNSILNQESEQDCEIILIDDASTDYTQDVIAGFRDSRIRTFRHDKNLGHVATVNEGFAAARGGFIARIDPDDRYRSCFMQSVLEKFRQYSDVGMVYGDAALIDESGKTTCESSYSVHGGKDFRGNEFVALLKKNFLCAPTMMARSEAWRCALPIPDDLAFNDWYFNLMISRRHDSYYIHRVLADYRVHPLNHHSLVVQNRTEEPSIFALLNRIFAETEVRDDLQSQKVREKDPIYAEQYLTLADKYFGSGMESDARRCYVKAIRHRPALAVNTGVIRHFIGAIIGRRLYDLSKDAIRSSLGTASK